MRGAALRVSEIIPRTKHQKINHIKDLKLSLNLSQPSVSPVRHYKTQTYFHDKQFALQNPVLLLKNIAEAFGKIQMTVLSESD